MIKPFFKFYNYLKKGFLFTIGGFILSIQFTYAGPNVPLLAPISRLSKEEAQQFLESFQNQKLSNSMVLKIHIKPITKNNDLSSYQGTLSLIPEQQQLKGQITLQSLKKSFEINFIQSLTPSISLKTEKTQTDIFVKNWLNPILPNCPYTPFEILMPFIYWEGTYQTSKRTGGRVVHCFSMHPPVLFKKELKNIQSVDIEIDAGFLVLKKAELFNESQQKLCTIAVESFKKFDNTWMIKTLSSIHYPNGQKYQILLNNIH